MARYGEQSACALCDSDIEYHGRHHDGGPTLGRLPAGWMDRGGNRFCDESGAARWDENGAPVPFPHRLHKPAPR